MQVVAVELAARLKKRLLADGLDRAIVMRARVGREG
jgi:hypothetical protein